MRRALPLMLILLATTWLAAGAAAQGEHPDLIRGALSLQVAETGYNGFALPVANSALGRSWARGTSFAWQAAYNYSVVPIRLEILHRLPSRFSGRVDIDLDIDGAEDGERITFLSREIMVPPSVPTTIMLAPRIVPFSEPGAVSRLNIRIYLGENEKPQHEQQITFIQLEPAHVYSLLLDGPPGEIYTGEINPGNARGLRFPTEDEVWEGAYGGNHYILSQDHRQVTGLPLAARDWAFVAADLDQVSAWPPEEQRALVEFALGGGHLCLFNTHGRDWLGCGLTRPTTVGRGVVLPVEGGFDEARGAMDSWLAGEIEELVLATGGSAGGEQLGGVSFQLDGRLAGIITGLYSTEGRTTGEVIHGPEFLHPVWAYRELCRNSALEPLENAELSIAEQDVTDNNVYLRQILFKPYQPTVRPLLSLLQTGRSIPSWYFWLTMAIPVLLFAGGLRVRRNWILPVLILLGLGVFAWMWWEAVPPPGPVANLRIVDLDTRLDAAVNRDLFATVPGQEGRVELELPRDALLRHVSGGKDQQRHGIPGEWEWLINRKGARWQGVSEEQLVSVTTDCTEDKPAGCPVRVEQDFNVNGEPRLLFNTEGVDDGRDCYLMLPTGWMVIPGGSESVPIEMQVPDTGIVPGAGRILAWDRFYASSLGTPTTYTSVLREQQLVIRQVCGLSVSGDDAYGQLFRAAVLQNPTGHLGLTTQEGVILVPIRHPKGNGHCLARLTFPLEAAR